MSVMDRDWTDKRMDDFADRVDRFEGNVDRRFDKVDARFDKVDADAAARSANSEGATALLSQKMDKMNRRVMSGLITVVGAVIIKVFLA